MKGETSAPSHQAPCPSLPPARLSSGSSHLNSPSCKPASLQSPGQAHSCISPAWASLGWSLNSRNCELGAGIDGGRGGSAMQLRWPVNFFLIFFAPRASSLIMPGSISLAEKALAFPLRIRRSTPVIVCENRKLSLSSGESVGATEFVPPCG